MVDRLLFLRADSNLVACYHTNGNGACKRGTSLNAACVGRSGKIASRLIAAGATTGVVDDRGCTPLHHAVDSLDDVEVISELLKLGADANASMRDGKTPLLLLCQRLILINEPLTENLLSPQYREQLVATLIKAGANANTSGDPLVATPLHLLSQAASHPFTLLSEQEALPLIRLLLEAGADPRLRIYSETAIERARAGRCYNLASEMELASGRGLLNFLARMTRRFRASK